MYCHVAWMGGAIATSDFLYEALVGSTSGEYRQNILETPNRLTSVAKGGLADLWCGRFGSHKSPVSPEGRSRGPPPQPCPKAEGVGEDGS